MDNPETSATTECHTCVTVGNEQALYNPTKRVGLVQNGHYLHLIEN
jgi:hypothetical protein